MKFTEPAAEFSRGVPEHGSLYLLQVASHVLSQAMRCKTSCLFLSTGSKHDEAQHGQHGSIHHTACFNGLCCRCAGCNFKGTRTTFETHLGSSARKCNQLLWLKEEQISLKVCKTLRGSQPVEGMLNTQWLPHTTKWWWRKPLVHNEGHCRHSSPNVCTGGWGVLLMGSMSQALCKGAPRWFKCSFMCGQICCWGLA